MSGGDFQNSKTVRRDSDTVRAMLLEFRRIAVVGLSPKEQRPSHYVSVYMKRAGYEIVPVNPGHDELLGERCYPRLSALPEPPEMVNVFRRSRFAGGVVDEAIAAVAKAVWLQKGVIDEEAAARAERVGLKVVMDL